MQQVFFQTPVTRIENIDAPLTREGTRFVPGTQGTAPSGAEHGSLCQAEEAERRPRLAGLQAERDAIFSFARHAKISDETSRKLVGEIDPGELRYRYR